MENKINYEKDIQIDESALDVEWLQQPRLMLKYSQHSIDTRKEQDRKQDELSIVEAELDKQIRKNPENFELSKVTEGAIKNVILSHDDYQEAKEQYDDARYEADMARTAVTAFDHRKKALENLVVLHGQQYFAGPKVPRDISEEWERKEATRRSNEKIKMKRKK